MLKDKLTIITCHLVLAAIIIVVSASVYATVQYSLRQAANDPQIEIAEETAAVINSGQPVESVVPLGANTDIAQSLAIFGIVYDQDGKVIASSAVLDGVAPVIPKSALDYANEHGQNRITWQPKDGVRIAAIIQKASTESGTVYVLAGRSLREIEKREAQVLIFAAVACALSLAIILLSLLFHLWRHKRHKAKHQAET